jgi:hypothetical protein
MSNSTANRPDYSKRSTASLASELSGILTREKGLRAELLSRMAVGDRVGAFSVTAGRKTFQPSLAADLLTPEQVAQATVTITKLDGAIVKRLVTESDYLRMVSVGNVTLRDNEAKRR